MTELITDIVSTDEFDQIINSERRPIVVDFKASWCTPCKILSGVLYEFKKDLGERVKVLTVDVDVNGELADRLKVKSVPTVMVYYEGEIKQKTVGLTTKAQLSDMVVKYV